MLGEGLHCLGGGLCFFFCGLSHEGWFRIIPDHTVGNVTPQEHD